MAKTLITVFALAALVFQQCGDRSQHNERMPSRFLIPAGYVGWVKVNYRVKDAPSLPIVSGYKLCKFPELGILVTSSDLEVGWATDEFYYYSANETRRIPHSSDNELIWSWNTGSEGKPIEDETPFQEFFVGTAEQYEKCWRQSVDDKQEPIVGRIDPQTCKRDNGSPGGF